jgi:hypothetical protein
MVLLSRGERKASQVLLTGIATVLGHNANEVM